MTTMLLLSFFIAGLSKMYKLGMTTTGEYAFLATIYDYIDKQTAAFQSSRAELVIRSSPICFGSILLVPFIRSDRWYQAIADVLNKGLYWFENILFIGLMAIGLIVLIPFNYIKTAIEVISLSLSFGRGTFSKSHTPGVGPYILSLSYIVPLWLTLGPIYLVAIFCKDLYCFCKCLAYRNEEALQSSKSVRDDL